MSIATSIAPRELLALDGDMYDAMRDELPGRWTNSEELLAQMVELLHAQLVAFVQVHRKRGSGRVAPPLVVPRPTDDDAAAAPASAQRVSVTELALMAGDSVERREVRHAG